MNAKEKKGEKKERKNDGKTGHFRENECSISFYLLLSTTIYISLSFLEMND
jgi:hypothetical protein